MTKQILAYGDSLTWGINSGVGRHRFEDRWPSVLEAASEDARVVADGLSGRTSCFDDQSAAAARNGASTLPVLLGSHYQLDVAVIMLGTNDLKSHICRCARGAAVAKASPIDGVHLDAANTRAIGATTADILKKTGFL